MPGTVSFFTWDCPAAIDTPIAAMTKIEITVLIFGLQFQKVLFKPRLVYNQPQVPETKNEDQNCFFHCGCLSDMCVLPGAVGESTASEGSANGRRQAGPLGFRASIAERQARSVGNLVSREQVHC